MKKVASKNRMVFLGGTAIVGVVAIFTFFVMAAAFAAPQAHAYAVGSTPPSNGPMPVAPADYSGGAGTGISGGSGAGAGSYNVDNSLQNLVSPFTNFMNSLKWNNNTTINTGGMTSGFPTINLTPTLEGGIQNTVSQWLSQFDNWFYSVTGVQLSGIFYVLLNAIAWTLGLAQRVVNWLLGLFH